MPQVYIQQSKTYLNMTVLVSCAFLILIITFQSIVLWSPTDLISLNKLQNQQIRVETMEKDAVALLQYPSFKSTYIGDMQALLPQWENDEQYLLNDLHPETAVTIKEADHDFQSIDVVLKDIIFHPDTKPDPVEVSVLLSHDHQYSLFVLSASLILQQSIFERELTLSIIEIALTSIVLIILLLYWLYERKVLGRLRERVLDIKNI